MMDDAERENLIAEVHAFLEPLFAQLGDQSAMLTWMCKDLIDEGQLNKVIAFARGGKAEADAALAILETEYVSIGRPMPQTLRDYAIDRRLGRIAFTPAGGGDWTRNVDRDFYIAQAMALMLGRGHTRGRNEATERDSAASIVAAALERLSSGRKVPGEKRVAEIWGEWEKRLGEVPNGRG